MSRPKKPIDAQPVVRQREAIARWQAEDLLRQAEVSYITDEQRRSVAWWWEHLAAGKVPLAHFSDRASRAKWSARRDRYWDKVTAEVLRKARFQAVNIRLKELQQMQQVRADLLELVTPTQVGDRKVFKVQPKSLEACVRALVSVGEFADATRDRVLALVEPELANQEAAEGGQGQRKTTFAPEEMRKVARLLLEERRRNQIIEIEEDNDDDDGEDDD